MKKLLLIIIVFSLTLSCFISCNSENTHPQGESVNNEFGNPPNGYPTGAPGQMPNGMPNDMPGGTSESDTTPPAGESLESIGAYDGLFDEESELNIKCVSGTENAYTLVDGVLTFTALSQDSVYSISGNFKGCIVVDVGDEYKLEIELCGFSIISETQNPIIAYSADELTVCAKKDYENYIYDQRDPIDEEDEALYSGAIHAECDLKVSGKGTLTVVSENNNGIHTKDDLKVKNLTLLVSCEDNALKGNDSVSIESGEITLIAKSGDGIKTSNSDISEKGNQRGRVTLSGGTCNIYAACDGIDAAYDAVIEGEDTVLNIYTDKYSSYSEEVSVSSCDEYYIRFLTDIYKYSVKYYNSDDDFVFVDATYHSTVVGGRNNYYYYSFPKTEGYSQMQFFIYTAEMEQSQDTEYAAASDLFAINAEYDTIAISARGNSLTFGWTNYTTNINEGMGGHGGFGGMQEGNSDKSEHSAKGIKAANSIEIRGGSVSVTSYDDAIHANSDEELENGSTPTGNVLISGGSLLIWSSDDGIHADGKLTVNAGNINVEKSYEGLEGSYVEINGGCIYIVSKDDGINSTATSGITISINGGESYIYSGGDGIDSNSRTSYEGIVFGGGKCVIISNSGDNSSIDTEAGYTYKGGCVIALMTRGGMTNEAMHASNFSSVAYSGQLSLSQNDVLNVKANGTALTLKMPCSMSSFIVVLGDTSPEISSSNDSSSQVGAHGVVWE